MATSDVYRNSGSKAIWLDELPVVGAIVLGVAGGALLELATFPMNQDCNQEVISLDYPNPENVYLLTGTHPLSPPSSFTACINEGL